MKHNTLSMATYIFKTAFWMFIAFIWFYNLILRPVEGKLKIGTLITMISIILLTAITNIALTRRWRRNDASVVFSVLIPFGLYSIKAYARFMPKMFRIVLTSAVILAIACIVFALALKLDALPEQKRLLRRARLSYLGLRFTGSLASLAIIICIIIKVFNYGGLVTPKEKPTSEYGEQYTIAANMDRVLKLQPEEWVGLDIHERMDVLQTVVNIEGNYLGLNLPIYLCAGNLDEYVLGTYEDPASRVMISLDVVEGNNPVSAVKVIAHELYHAAAHRYVDLYNKLSEEDQKLYFLRDAKTFAWEVEHYKSGTDADDASSFYAYYDQAFERKAREYADDCALDYYGRIEEYLNQEMPGIYFD